MRWVIYSLLILCLFPIILHDVHGQSSEFISIVEDDSQTATGQSSNAEIVNSANVNINLEALSEPAMNITVFGQTLRVTHEETIFRNATDYTYIGSTENAKNNVFIGL